MSVRCFLIEPTGRVRRWLRRFRWSSQMPSPCPAAGNHDAMAYLDDKGFDGRLPVVGDLWSHDDPRWPQACACGYAFAPDDEWQLFINPLYRRADTGDIFPLREAPAGAMWFNDWFPYRGPDGHCLVVKTPAGEWLVDAPSSGERGKPDAKGWERAGAPPNVTARPSIFIPDEKGGFRYHAFLTNGTLEEC